jgi:hypothetical protein
LLTPLAAPPIQAGTTDRPESRVIGVGPIHIPKYLDRPQIVTRATEQRLQLGEFDRWAEPLESAFPRVLVENLSRILATEEVTLWPSANRPMVTQRLAVEVIRFDGTPDGAAALVARWTVLGKDGNEIVPPTRSEFVIPSPSPGYEGMAKALSQAVERLSHDVASALRGLPRTN